MKKAIFVLAFAMAFISFGNSAFAYELGAPVTVTATSGIHEGSSGEVDFSRVSSVEGTISVDNTQDESAWVTAGDVVGGKSGYGFYVHENQIFGVSRTGDSQWLLPLGFVRYNTTVTVKAVYTPGNGIRFDTSWATSDLAQYSRGIIQDMLPYGAYRGLGAFNASITSRSNPANLFVGSWRYQ